MGYEFGPFSVDRLVAEKWNQNCYLVKERDSNEIAVIDPGDDAEIIISRLEQGGGTVRHILLTHGHYDHFGAASALCEHTGVPCSLSQSDIQLLRRAPLYAMAFEKIGIEIPRDIAGFAGERTFELGERTFQVLSTPGHTSGSVCFQFGSFIFTGDTLLHGTLGRTDFPGGNSEQLSSSVETLVTNLAKDTVILPGHGHSWNGKEAQAWWKGAHAPPISHAAGKR